MSIKTKSDNPTQAGLVPAVGYVRRSTDRQETSLPEQVKAVQQYADDKGYKILRWYTDDAISGDDTEKRHAFQQMIADATGLRDFQAILCWDQSRFGRFSPQEAGYWTYPLAKANIQLVTTDKGPMDWGTFTGWLTYSVNQQGKHEYLVDLSKDVVRGQREAVESGSWVGSPPYAYNIVGAKKRKRLALGDPGKVRIVQRIFREFVEEGRAMKNIADRLNAEGVVSPGGKAKGWRFDTVKVILENPAYTGDFAGSRWHYGKFHRNQSGKTVEANGERGRNPKAEWIIRQDHHDAIIDRATFEKAQAILAKGKGRAPHTPETNPYALSCRLRCGRCGSVLRGDTHKKRRYYECGNQQYNGKEACEGTTVREDVILRSIADYLEGWLGFEGEAIGTAAYYGGLKAEDLPEAFAAIRAIVAPPQKPGMDRKRLEKQAEQARAQLAKARANLVLLDADNIPAAQDRIRKLDEERAGLERELRECRQPAEKDINAVALEVMHNLYSLAYCCRTLATQIEEGWEVRGSLESAAPQAVRRFMNHANHIVCHTAIQGSSTRIRHVFERGEIVFKGVGGVTGDLNPTRNDTYSPAGRKLGQIVIPFGPRAS